MRSPSPFVRPGRTGGRAGKGRGRQACARGGEEAGGSARAPNVPAAPRPPFRPVSVGDPGSEALWRLVADSYSPDLGRPLTVPGIRCEGVCGPKEVPCGLLPRKARLAVGAAAWRSADRDSKANVQSAAPTRLIHGWGSGPGSSKRRHCQLII